MKEKTRTEYSVRNATVAFIGKILVLLFAYASRVVFVRVLNTTYTGVNNLLNNLLGIFAITSLGVDTALVFLLYTPIVKKDYARQRVLMRVYNKIHLIIAGIIAAFALIMFILMPYISKDSLEISNFALVYWMFAGNVIFSYVFSHKTMIFIATQQNFINEIIETVQLILQYILQIAVLLITKNFVLFTLIYFVSIILKNIAINIYANKKYPYLKQKSSEPLDPEDEKSIKKNLGAILLQKFGIKLINYTDTLILSSLFGIISIARYGNYSLIMISVNQLLEKVISSITGSVGNLGATTDKKNVEKVFNASLLITCAIYGVISVCMYEALDLFIKLSFGADYVYAKEITLVLTVNFYLRGVRSITVVFRNSLGLFWNDRYRSIAEAGANIVLSLLAILLFGEVGIFIGTTLTMLVIPIWIEPLVLYKNYFNKTLAGYFVRMGSYTAIVLAAGVISDTICRFISASIIPLMISRAAIGAVVTVIMLCITLFRTEEFKALRAMAIGIIKPRGNKE